MAKKEKVKKTSENIEDIENIEQEDELQEQSKKQKTKKIKIKKGKSKIIPIFIMFSILGGLGAAIYFNTFGIRNQYIIPLIQKIPIVKNILPVTDEELASVKELSKEELITKNNDLEKQIATLIEENDILDKKNKLYGEEVSRLQDIEYQQVKYKKEKEEFDTMIVAGDQKAFLQFYEKISPQNADKLYTEALVSTQQTKEKKSFVSTFSAMDEKSASKILEEMLTSDMDLVVDVLKNVGSERSAAILSAMDTKNAASVAKRMSPKNE